MVKENNFLFHEVSEKEKEEIKQNAKKLLDEFSSKLEKIKTSDVEHEKKENLREEGKGWETNKEFREFMMDNAPLVENGLIIAEKGNWKK